jgi:hypothetical protein
MTHGSGGSMSTGSDVTESPRPIASATEPPNGLPNGPSSGSQPVGLRQRAEQAATQQAITASLGPIIQAAASGAASAAAVAAAAEIERRIAPVLEDLEAVRRQLETERVRWQTERASLLEALQMARHEAAQVVRAQAEATQALRSLERSAAETARVSLTEFRQLAGALRPPR